MTHGPRGTHESWLTNDVYCATIHTFQIVTRQQLIVVCLLRWKVYHITMESSTIWNKAV